jgi:site-specific recombinase XerD
MPRAVTLVVSDDNQTELMTKAYLEIGEVQRLEQSANNVRDRLLIRLLYHLGCLVSDHGVCRSRLRVLIDHYYRPASE